MEIADEAHARGVLGRRHGSASATVFALALAEGTAASACGGEELKECGSGATQLDPSILAPLAWTDHRSPVAPESDSSR